MTNSVAAIVCAAVWARYYEEKLGRSRLELCFGDRLKYRYANADMGGE